MSGVRAILIVASHRRCRRTRFLMAATPRG